MGCELYSFMFSTSWIYVECPQSECCVTYQMDGKLGERCAKNIHKNKKVASISRIYQQRSFEHLRGSPGAAISTTNHGALSFLNEPPRCGLSIQSRRVFPVRSFCIEPRWSHDLWNFYIRVGGRRPIDPGRPLIIPQLQMTSK